MRATRRRFFQAVASAFAIPGATGAVAGLAQRPADEIPAVADVPLLCAGCGLHTMRLSSLENPGWRMEVCKGRRTCRFYGRPFMARPITMHSPNGTEAICMNYEFIEVHDLDASSKRMWHIEFGPHVQWM